MNIKKAEQLLSRLRRRVDFLDDGGRSIKPTQRAIRLVQKYEQDYLGEAYTPVEPNRIANMLVYIYGEFLLNKSEHLQKVWDDKLTQRDLRIIRKEIMDWCENNLPKDKFSTERVLDGLIWDEYGTY